ncbi:sporulation protein Cse60 [Paenibacillus sp. N3.4]|uniref:sporulation protein Cse60 n=1 Tax=Paenibacillus sp. N3.4 TaxID=2603222 RepID=UPI0011C972C4|nr:sporulation protein Cse60 [Paenibacillus sp. N3.4]TXK83731.1 sporulation protein Cse60 [Paenibacillus sp. N3.4]
MIQVKEFVDTDNIYAENKANEFLAKLEDNQIINVCYGSVMKSTPTGEYQRSTILIVYRAS